jgi:hypothetical protein
MQQIIEEYGTSIIMGIVGFGIMKVMSQLLFLISGGGI